MNRRVLLAIILLAVAAGGCAWWWFGTRPSPVMWQGYAEADYVKVGPTQAGLLTAGSVASTQTVVLYVK